MKRVGVTIGRRSNPPKTKDSSAAQPLRAQSGQGQSWTPIYNNRPDTEHLSFDGLFLHLLSASTIGSENNSDQYHCNHCAYGFHRWFLPGSFLPDWLSGEPLPGMATPGPARPKKLLTRPVSRLHRQQTAPFPKPAKTRW